MPNDEPIAVLDDGRKIYDNAVTVVVAVVMRPVYDHFEVITLRRANEPGKGRIALPGGYQMRGETYLEACSRELFEETGVKILPQDLQFWHIEPDTIYGNNLIFCTPKVSANIDFSGMKAEEGEAEEVLPMDHPAASKADWAFPLHKEAALWNLSRQTYRIPCDE